MSENRFGLVLPLKVYAPERVAWAERALTSLLKTQHRGIVPIVVAWDEASGFWSTEWEQKFLSKEFDTRVVRTHEFTSGVNQTLVYGTQELFRNFEAVTHAVWVFDDFVYNLRWLEQLDGLVSRHPDAKAWSVYRSAHIQHHRTIRQEGEDVLVASLCGGGMTISRQEWEEYGLDYRQAHSTPVPTGGNTVDLHHAWARPGERWATWQSYMQNIGVTGEHTHAGVPAYAQQWVGEEA